MIKRIGVNSTLAPSFCAERSAVAESIDRLGPCDFAQGDRSFVPGDGSFSRFERGADRFVQNYDVVLAFPAPSFCAERSAVAESIDRLGPCDFAQGDRCFRQSDSSFVRDDNSFSSFVQGDSCFDP
jgi:hypothetical protein